ncbi:ACR3 family arsenite efflux pump ArsB [Nocardia puris]|uniref:ACR3 family arsenite efflux pump ArsB n=2 Tax=Nocardia puris TaxID=208602 RepID=A0A366DWD9_9NOCA|nr:ACR3 family arsenite efflux pump ArsB [Nocardia puris]
MRTSMTAWLERHQIPVYSAALAVGALVGFVWPGAGHGLEVSIYPVLGTLLYATFLQVPFTAFGAAFRDVRFLATVLVVNFVVVPPVVAVLTMFLSLPQAVLLGVLLTLLTPCIDYVIVFSGLAGGDSQRLLAAAPLLMLAQMLLLPVCLWLFVGADLADVVEAGPFLEAFLLLIALPLALAWGTQLLARRHRAGEVLTGAMSTAMVPLMAATLLVVVASQFPKITGEFDQVARVVPIYAAFLIVMPVLGLAVARLARLGTGPGIALLFSGATRNSLVVLPLALALPDGYALTPVIVLTQTLVELVGMVIYVRVVPGLTRAALPANP